MNYLLDSNILLYAKMNAMPEHLIISKWLEQAVRDQNNTINICETSILSFVRIATSSKVFNPTLPLNEAQSFIDSLLAASNVNLLLTTPKHYSDLFELIDKHKLQGNLVMDAHLATLALAIGATLVTRDKDFVKIPYLNTLNPFTI